MKRYLGKIKEWSLLKINNAFPTNTDGSINEYHNGTLIWADQNGKFYHIKNMNVEQIPEEYQKFGFTHNVTIDLDKKYLVDECELE